jgi:seryl-tRNA synthetase
MDAKTVVQSSRTRRNVVLQVELDNILAESNKLSKDIRLMKAERNQAAILKEKTVLGKK